MLNSRDPRRRFFSFRWNSSCCRPPTTAASTGRRAGRQISYGQISSRQEPARQIPGCGPGPAGDQRLILISYSQQCSAALLFHRRTDRRPVVGPRSRIGCKLTFALRNGAYAAGVCQADKAASFGCAKMMNCAPQLASRIGEGDGSGPCCELANRPSRQERRGAGGRSIAANQWRL